MEMFEVGGCVRDEILGIPSKDIDFTVVLPPGSYRDPFEFMCEELEKQGYDIKVTTPEFLTARAVFPKGHKYRGGADFVLSRKEGGYSDGRRPDSVRLGTLEDDLARRDFTMNAIAKDSSGRLIDPHGGVQDIANRLIRAVGDARTRIIEEDALRGLRALRFAVTKDFAIDSDVEDVLLSGEFRRALRNIATERIQTELDKMFKFNTVTAFDAIYVYGLQYALFDNTGLRLMPTMKG